MQSKQAKNKAKRPTHGWAADQDYWDKLSVEERAWLAQFNAEYYRAEFKRARPAIHPEHFKPDCRRRNKRMWQDAMAGAEMLQEQLTPHRPMAAEGEDDHE